jgi:hypothetical protein
VDAFRAAGGHVDFRVLPPWGDEGHWFAERANPSELAPWLPSGVSPAADKDAPRR